MNALNYILTGQGDRPPPLVKFRADSFQNSQLPQHASLMLMENLIDKRQLAEVDDVSDSDAATADDAAMQALAAYAAFFVENEMVNVDADALEEKRLQFSKLRKKALKMDTARI